jgi:hypothetical protein
MFGKHSYDNYFAHLCVVTTASVVWWSDFLATDSEALGSILGTTRFSEEVVGLELWSGGQSSWLQIQRP